MKPGAVCIFETPLLALCHPEMRLPRPGPGPCDSLPLPPVCSVLTASVGNPLVRSRGRVPEIRVWVRRADCGFNKTRFASGRRGLGTGPREQRPAVPGRSWPLALKLDFPQASEGLLDAGDRLVPHRLYS